MWFEYPHSEETVKSALALGRRPSLTMRERLRIVTLPVQAG
jgi:hypothetical protein